MECNGILIIEDEQEIRDTLRQLLELEGHKVYTAANGAEGLQRLRVMPPPCSIILDILMPVMSGWQFLDARQQDEALSSIPVAIVSGIAQKPASIPRATVFIRKPIDFDVLLGFVNEQHQARARRNDGSVQEIGV